MILDRHLIQDLSTLTKTEIVKRLQAAVRNTQGTKRASWAPTSRPAWWVEDHAIQFPDGRTIKSLRFESKSKANWDVDRARTTLLLYIHRHTLLNNQPTDVPKSPHSPHLAHAVSLGNPQPPDHDPAHSHNSPPPQQLVARKPTTDHQTCALISSDNHSRAIQRQEHTKPKHAAAPNSSSPNGKRRRRARALPKHLDQAVHIVQHNAQSSCTQPSPKRTKRCSDQTDQTELHTANGEHQAADGNDCDVSSSEPSHETDQVTAVDHHATQTDQVAKRQRLIHDNKAALQTQVTQELKKLDRRVKVKRDEITRRLAVEIEAVQNAHAVTRFQLSKEACDTPLVQYINECNADSREWLLKMVAGRATRSFEDLDGVDEHHHTSRTKSQQDRMNEALQTARKVTRAARQREIDNGRCKMPATLARGRPTRTAAKTALKRNQEIFGRAKENRATGTSTTRGRRNQDGKNGGGETPSREGEVSQMEVMRQCISLLKTQRNPQRFVQECLTALNEQAERE